MKQEFYVFGNGDGTAPFLESLGRPSPTYSLTDLIQQHGIVWGISGTVCENADGRMEEIHVNSFWQEWEHRHAG